MRKHLTVISIVLLLAAIVCMERTLVSTRGTRSVSFAEGRSGGREPDRATRPERMRRDRFSRDAGQSGQGAVESPGFADPSSAGSGERETTDTSGGIAASHRLRIRFIRSRDILGIFKVPQEKIPQENIDALKEAVDRVAQGFDGPLYIFDADGRTKSGARPLIFARPGFDMTATVQAEYARVCEEHGMLVNSREWEQAPQSDSNKPSN